MLRARQKAHRPPSPAAQLAWHTSRPSISAPDCPAAARMYVCHPVGAATCHRSSTSYCSTGREHQAGCAQDGCSWINLVLWCMQPPLKGCQCKVGLHAIEAESWADGRCHLGASQKSESVWTSSLCPVCTCSQALRSRSEGEWGAKPARPPMARSMVLSLATPLQQCTQPCQAADECTEEMSDRPAPHLPSSYA